VCHFPALMLFFESLFADAQDRNDRHDPRRHDAAVGGGSQEQTEPQVIYGLTQSGVPF
jgi:hypothetical protein